MANEQDKSKDITKQNKSIETCHLPSIRLGGLKGPPWGGWGLGGRTGRGGGGGCVNRMWSWSRSWPPAWATGTVEVVWILPVVVSSARRLQSIPNQPGLHLHSHGCSQTPFSHPGYLTQVSHLGPVQPTRHQHSSGLLQNPVVSLQPKINYLFIVWKNSWNCVKLLYLLDTWACGRNAPRSRGYSCTPLVFHRFLQK